MELYNIKKSKTSENKKEKSSQILLRDLLSSDDVFCREIDSEKYKFALKIIN